MLTHLAAHRRTYQTAVAETLNVRLARCRKRTRPTRLVVVRRTTRAIYNLSEHCSRDARQHCCCYRAKYHCYKNCTAYKSLLMAYQANFLHTQCSSKINVPTSPPNAGCQAVRLAILATAKFNFIALVIFVPKILIMVEI